mgnify:CR=1 FL=1|tara:strand:+ start:136 stop:525 length:390 start_codon:yes stop_codon:yes gene_type:complete
MNKILSWLTGDLFKKVTSSIDSLITSDEEKLILKNDLHKLLIDESTKVNELKSSIIREEAKGNFLQRSWRPILMLNFGFIVTYCKFLAPAFDLPIVVLEPQFWSLLNLGIGGYVIGRSSEKIVNTIKNK